MPDSDTPLLDAQPEGGGSGDTPSTPAAPQYVDAGRFDEFRQTVQGTLGAISETLTALRETRPVPVAAAPAAVEDVSDTEIDEALQAGRGAPVFRKMVDAAVKRVRREEIDPLRQQMVSTATDLVANVATRDLRHYPKYKKEIDTMVAALPPETRVNPALWKWAHDVVVGQHVDEIAAEAVNAALRPAPTPEPMLRTARAGRGTPAGGAEATPDVYDVAGDEGEAALAHHGVDRDGFAKKLGYKNWTDYMKQTKEYR